MRSQVKLASIIILAAFASIPMGYSIDFSAGIIFQGSGGGNVTFAQGFSATNVVLGPNRFYNFIWDGNLRGTFGVDCDADVNVTVTQVNKKQVAYTVHTGAPGDVTSYIYYLQTKSGGTTAPTSVTANGSPATYSFSAATGIVSVTTRGASVPVLVSYMPGEQTNLYRKLVIYVKLATLIPLVVAIIYVWQVYQTGGFNTQTAATITGLVITMIVVVYMMAKLL